MATINDVAKITGVSKATVSNVLNNKGRVSDKVREEVFAAARDINFSMNTVARQLVSKRSNIIGLFVPDTDYLSKSLFFATLSSGIIEAATSSGFSVNLILTGKEKFFEHAVMIDGAIILNPEKKQGYYEQLQGAGFPVVIIGRPEENESLLTYVDVENISISYTMTKRLLDFNHCRILLITGPREYTISQDQITGYQKAHAEAGVKFSDSLVFSAKYFIQTELNGFEEVFDAQKPTAVLCPTDRSSVEVMHILLKKGLQIPKDVSVACLSGSFITEKFIPAVTGIVAPLKDIGVSAAKLLFRLIDKKLLRPVSRIFDYSIFEGTSISKNLKKI